MPKPSQQRPPQEQDRQPGREDEMVPQPRYEGEGYRPAGKLADKVALISGGDSGIGRPGQPEELAPAYVYLACDDSSYVTGQTIHVNGGEIIGG